MSTAPHHADYDLVVLGAGSAAYAAAIQAREAGHSVALVESNVLGGTCVNVGCVPSKSLLHDAEVFHEAARHGFVSPPLDAPHSGVGDFVDRKDALVGALRQEKYIDLVDAYGIDVVKGTGTFTDPGTVTIGGRSLRGRYFLIATGASPAVPTIPGLEESGYLTSTTALDAREAPPRLAVIGASAVGLELGQYFSHSGSRVTFIDIAPQIAPTEEPEAAARLADVLRGEGAEVVTGAQVDRVELAEGGRRLTIRSEAGEQRVEVDEILVATGRRPNTAALNLEAADVDVEAAGAVAVDEFQRTSNPRVFAAGDVTSAPQFVYVAAHQGALAARNALLDANEPSDLIGLPRVTFTTPQLAGAGITEAESRSRGHDVSVAVLDLEDVPRARVNRDTRGVFKLVTDAATDRLLGATVLADCAGDVIQSATLAIRAGMTSRDLANTFHPYLTMVEGLRLTAQSFTRDVKKLSCCAA